MAGYTLSYLSAKLIVALSWRVLRVKHSTLLMMMTFKQELHNTEVLQISVCFQVH